MRNKLLQKEIQEEIILAAKNKRIRKAQKRLKTNKQDKNA